MTNDQTLSQGQLFLILIHAQVGIAIVTLPADLFPRAGNQAWLSVLITGAIIQGVIYLYHRLIQRFPGGNLYTILEAVFGRILGKVLITLYALYFVLIGAVLLSVYVVILKTWMMPVTPKWLLAGLLLAIAIFLVIEDLSIIARFFVLAMIIMVCFIALSTIALKDARLVYIFPLTGEGLGPILKAIPKTFYAYQGFETLLFIYPYVKMTEQKSLKTASLANLFVTCLYSLMVFISIVFFSPNELKLIPEPVLYLVKSLSFKIIERPDLLFTSMWLVLVLTSIVVILYCSSLGLMSLFDLKRRDPFVYVSAVLAFILSMFIYGEYRVRLVNQYLHPTIIIFTILIPILCLLLSVLLKRKEESQ